MNFRIFRSLLFCVTIDNIELVASILALSHFWIRYFVFSLKDFLSWLSLGKFDKVSMVLLYSPDGTFLTLGMHDFGRVPEAGERVRQRFF